MLINKHILDDKYIFELASIFKEKGWTIEQSTDDEYSIFDLFCDRLQSLESDSDRDLIIELTKNYLVVDVDEYCKYLSKTLKIFFEEKKYLLDNLDTIHVFPVQDKDYIDKTKSGNIICYFLQGIVFRKFSVFRDKRVRIIETFNGLEKHKDEIEILMLVDDYVGSGDIRFNAKLVAARLHIVHQAGVVHLARHAWLRPARQIDVWPVKNQKFHPVPPVQLPASGPACRC